MSRVIEALGPLKASAGVAIATMVSGASTILGILPDSIGKLASFAGFCLTLVMIMYWRKNTTKIDQELAKLKIDIEIRQIELEHARREAEHRRRAEDQ